jgi:hypothetical protein
MRAAIFFRISAVLLLLFAAGHTFGFLTFTPPTEQGIAVRDAMNHVHFEVKGAIFSYGGFYRGFGLSATVGLLFEAFVAWHLAAVARRNPSEAVAIGWALFAQQVAGFVLAWMYFAIVPAILSGLLALLIGYASWLATSDKTHPEKL